MSNEIEQENLNISIPKPIIETIINSNIEICSTLSSKQEDLQTLNNLRYFF